MTLRELKKHIMDNTLPKKLYIFNYEDTTLMVNEYVNKLVENTGQEISYLQSLEELNNLVGGFFFDDDNTLYILHIDKLDKELPKYLEKINCIIICREVDNNNDFCIVNFPKIEQWQLIDYATIKLQGVDKRKIEWLVDIFNDNPYRLYHEIEKISQFPIDQRDRMFDLINQDGGYDDVTKLTIFNLVNAISRKNKKEVIEVLEAIKLIDIDPIGLTTLLLKQFKNLINVKMGTSTYKDLGMSQKQYDAIRRYNHYTPKELVNAYDLLTSIDCKVKNGEIDTSYLIDYILCKIL